MSMPIEPATLFLPCEFHADYTSKGWFQGAAKFTSGMYIPITFVSSDWVIGPGKYGLTEPNMVVIDEVTVENMEQAVTALDLKEWICCVYAFTESEIQESLVKDDWPPRPPVRNDSPTEWREALCDAWDF